MLTIAAARELTWFVGLQWSEDDRDLLGPLVDAVLVWADDDRLVRAAGPVLDTLWRDDLRDDIERALAAAAEKHEEVARLRDAAEADLARGPRGSRLALAVVEQGAQELAAVEMLPVHCLLCVEEALAAAAPGERARIALRVGRIAWRAARVPTDEVRAAIAASSLPGAAADVATALAADDRRLAVRAWLRGLGELGAESVPALSAELLAAADGPLPPVESDELWRETVRGLVETLDAGWN